VTAPPLRGARLVRAVHLHTTPARLAGRLEAQLAALAERFSAVTEDDLAALLDGRDPGLPRPGLIVGVFNGHREGATVLAPILDRVGLVGWFFVVTAFVDAPPGAQRAFAAAHGIPVAAGAERPAMSWEELAAVGRRHVIASHTRTHQALHADLAPEVLDAEVRGSRLELETRLGRRVRTFAAHRGAGLGTGPAVDAALLRSGYDFVVANHAVQRLTTGRERRPAVPART
jgi:peptidoglycan/xylan/chitin deacetylase (PgdA/CDA1 family)